MPYTRSLLAAEPVRTRRASSGAGAERRRWPAAASPSPIARQLAVAGVDLALQSGRTLAVVGEWAAANPLWRGRCCQLQPCKGEIRWMGRPVERLEGLNLRRARAQAQIVFQDP